MTYRCPVSSTRNLSSQIEGATYVFGEWSIKIDSIQERVNMFRQSGNPNEIVLFSTAQLRPLLDSEGLIHILSGVNVYNIKVNSQPFVSKNDFLAIENSIKLHNSWGCKKSWSFFKKALYNREGYNYISTSTWGGLYYDQKSLVADELFLTRFPADLTLDGYYNISAEERKKLCVNEPNKYWGSYISTKVLSDPRITHGKVVMMLEGEI